MNTHRTTNATKEHAGRQPGADNAEHYTAKNTAPRTLKQRAQRLIIGAACWGVLPIPAADWLIRVLRLGAV